MASGATSVFQFHKGTIKPTVRLLLILSRMYFNSIKVRLNPVQQLNNGPVYYEFQFHKGTIKPFEINLPL